MPRAARLASLGRAAALLGRRPDLGQEQGVLRPLHADALPDEALDPLEREGARLVDQADGLPGRARPRRPADPVDVVLGVLRQVPVVDVGDLGNVKPPRRHVGGHEDRHAPVLERLQGAEALSLLDVTAEGPGRVAIPLEALHQAVDLVARVGEDQDPPALLGREQAQQEAELLVAPGVVEHLLDALDGHLLRRHRDLRGVVHELVGELEDAEGQGGREQEGLARLGRRQPAEDPPDVGDEAHVEHPVRLVEHEHLDPGRRPRALLQVVDQPPGRPDQEVERAPERLPLLDVVHAAEDERRAETREAAELPRVRIDLDDELPRGRDDQGARRRLAGSGRRVAEEPGEGRDQERGRLAGAGLGLARHVLAAEGDRQRRLLDGRGRREPRGPDPLLDLGRHVELGESHRGQAAARFRRPPNSRAATMPAS